jgi:hypothetical protein
MDHYTCGILNSDLNTAPLHLLESVRRAVAISRVKHDKRVKVKVKFILEQPTKTQKGSIGIDLSLTSALDRDG